MKRCQEPPKIVAVFTAQEAYDALKAQYPERLAEVFGDVRMFLQGGILTVRQVEP